MFNLFYYSQIQLALIASALTAATSSVLLGKISWESVILAGVSTFITYSTDNLLDWKKDLRQHQDLVGFLSAYRLSCYILIPLGIGVISKIVIDSPAKFQSALLLLGASAISAIIRIPTRNAPPTPSNIQSMAINRLFISCVWAVVLVFLPILYTESNISRPQVWMTFAYLWQLTFISAVMWKFEKIEPNIQNNSFLKSKTIKILKLLSITTVLLTITDIVLGYFPIYNLVVVLAPIAAYLVLIYWESSNMNLRLIFTILNMIQIGVSILSAAVHLQ
jgi:hypothetical protein